jgi:2',3'-cyclic-nucleotide 2'-phosphodiesterase / 3'-nucleotidase / 5'-nucleotidase
MKSLIVTLTVSGLLAGAPSGPAQPPGIQLTPVGSYASGKFDEAAAEIVAHDPATQNLFVINAQSAEVDVLSITNPATPVKVGSIDVKPYGGIANSVAVRDGIIAVAVENQVKTSPGVVVFFDRNLNFLSQVTVGALPDMLTFTPNGRYVLVANEGEPNSDYSIDPEGSVSIIDMKGGAKKLTDAQGEDRQLRAVQQRGA